jgi:hypothetical protein
MEKNLNEVGKRIGIATDEVKNILRRRKREIVIGGIVILALAFASNILYVGTYYGGTSLEDFLKNFRILRWLFGWV